MTSLAEERAEQTRWKLRPQYAGLDVFDDLVENEFTSPRRIALEEAKALRAVLDFAVAEVPYYRSLFARLGLAARDIRDHRDLPRLPILGRRELREEFDNLKPDRLPAGVQIHGIVKSSGSTGPATRVVSSTANNLMFSILNQRQTRWFRRDPAGTLAYIRLPGSFPQPRPGEWLACGETLRLPGWRYLGTFFETGPAIAFSILNSDEEQIAWLRHERPDYLVTRSHSLAHLAMAASGERVCDSLKAMTAISEDITPETRRYIGSKFGAPVQMAYGLNEIGLVATLCDAGRYHVHREHCIVEIVDGSGMPCQPGEAGRLLVTGLRNFAMPLVRYDSNDLVTALDGPCPCGRTLPSFGEIHGRYSRIEPLPAGTMDRVATLRTVLQTMPLELARDLRRYQIHQFRDGGFELRLVAAGRLPPAFYERVGNAWSNMNAMGIPPLAIREVEDIPLDTAVDKFMDFVSEYF